MMEFQKRLYKNDEYDYPTKVFIPFIYGYLHEDMVKRPAVIIVP